MVKGTLSFIKFCYNVGNNSLMLHVTTTFAARNMVGAENNHRGEFTPWQKSRKHTDRSQSELALVKK